MEQEKCKTCGRPAMQREVGLCCAGEKCLSLLGNQWRLGDFDLNELHVWYQIAVKAYRQDAAKRIVAEFEHRLPFLMARPDVERKIDDKGNPPPSTGERHTRRVDLLMAMPDVEKRKDAMIDPDTGHPRREPMTPGSPSSHP